MTIEIKRLNRDDIQDWEALINVFEEVFGMKNFLLPDRDYLQHLLDNQHFMVYVAAFGEEVVGGLTAYLLPSYYYQSSEVYIYDLAVSVPYQRKGTGRKLIDVLKTDCKKLGLKEVFVQANTVDRKVLDFYHATGGSAEEVMHFYYPL